jgi:hypothetical protein
MCDAPAEGIVLLPTVTIAMVTKTAARTISNISLSSIEWDNVGRTRENPRYFDEQKSKVSSRNSEV